MEKVAKEERDMQWRRKEYRTGDAMEKECIMGKEYITGEGS